VSDPWNEVMKLAEKYGFIFYAHGGVTLLLSHEEQKKQDVFEGVQYKCGLAPHPSKVGNQ